MTKPAPRRDDDVATTRRKLAHLLAIGALRAIAGERPKPEDKPSPER